MHKKPPQSWNQKGAASIIIDQLESLPPRALTAGQLASMLNVHRSTIYRKAAQGVIPSFPLGDSVRFDPKRVAGFLRSQMR